jgi:hypothetical protein
MEIYHFGSGIEVMPHLNEYNLLFLIGSCDDQAFWFARDFVQSKDPHFFVTFGLAKDGVDWPNLSENESILTFETPEDMVKISKTIHHLYAAALPGYICLGSEGIRAALGAMALT